MPGIEHLGIQHSSKLSFFRAFRCLRSLRVIRVVGFWSPGLTRRLIEAGLAVVCGVFVLTACVYQVEKIGSVQFSVGHLNFFESFYFTARLSGVLLRRFARGSIVPRRRGPQTQVVTLTTIGYGDIYPAKLESRAIVAVCVPLLVVIVPIKLSGLYELAKSYSAYARAARLGSPTKEWYRGRRPKSLLSRRDEARSGWFLQRWTTGVALVPTLENRARTRAIRRYHVVIAGNIGALDAEGYRLSGQLPLALEHVYDSRRRGKGQQNTFLRLVLLQPSDPSVPVRTQLLEHPFYETRLRWVAGTVFDETSLLDWVQGATARAFVVLGDDAVDFDGKEREDNLTIQRVLAIRRALPEARIVAQLLLGQNAHRLARENVELVCCDAFKYAMLGRSVRHPGLGLLLTSMLADAPDDAASHVDEAILGERQMLKSYRKSTRRMGALAVDDEAVAEELKTGRSAKLASALCPPGAAGLTFLELASAAAKEGGALPVAITRGGDAVATCPASYVLRGDDRLLAPRPRRNLRTVRTELSTP